MFKDNKAYKNFAIDYCLMGKKSIKDFEKYYTHEILNENFSNSQKVKLFLEIKLVLQTQLYIRQQDFIKDGFYFDYKNTDILTQNILDAIFFCENCILEISINSALKTEIFGSKNNIEKSNCSANELALIFHLLREEKIINFSNKRMGLIISQITDYGERFGDIFTLQDYLEDENAKKRVAEILKKIINKIANKSY